MDTPSSTHCFQTFREQHIELFLLFPGHMLPHFFGNFFQSHGQLTKSLSSKKTHFFVVLWPTEVIRSHMPFKLFKRALKQDQSQLSSFSSLAAMLKNVQGSKSILAVKDHRAPFLHFWKWFVNFKWVSILNGLSYNNEIALKWKIFQRGF